MKYSGELEEMLQNVIDLSVSHSYHKATASCGETCFGWVIVNDV